VTGGGHRYTAVPSPALEAELERALAGIAAEIDALNLPKLRAVALGGGYGRGEGGVRHTERGDRLYNDLDFFVFASGADGAAARRIDRALERVSEQWERRLGVAVDFGPVKNLEALKKVTGTLMYQELLRGWKSVWGEADWTQFLAALPPERLPFSEAARLLLNRGMGLLFAGDCLRKGSEDADFIVRNMNKALLGCGDALLLASGRYRWRGAERVAAFAGYVQKEGLPAEYARFYEKAARWKLEPVPVLSAHPAEQWGECRGFFLDAVCQAAGVPEGSDRRAVAAGLSRNARKERSLKNFLRWARRTGRVRRRGMWDAPAVTVLGKLYAHIRECGGLPECPSELRRLWKAFR